MKALLYSNPAVRRWLVMNVLACSVLVGFALRLLLAQRSGLWRDEGLFLFIVRFPTLRDIFHFLHYHESHPPLFYLLMRGWQAVFGPSDAAALALPLLLGALFPIAVFLVGRVLFGLRAALLATVFACVSPGLCAYSAQVRPYSLLPLLCLLSVFFVWQALQGQGKGAWGWYTLVTLCLLYTHNWSWLVLLGEWVAVGLAGRLPALQPQGKEGKAGSGRFVLCQVVLLVGYAPWMPVLLYQARHAGFGPKPFAEMPSYLGYSLGIAFGMPRKLALLCLAALVVAVIWVLLRLLKGEIQDKQERLLAVWLCLCVPLTALAASSILIVRSDTLRPYTALIVVPCLLLATSYGLVLLTWSFRRSPSDRRHAPHSLSAWMIVLAVGLVLLYQVGTVLRPDHFVKSNAREVALAVASQAQPSDLIVVAPEWLASSFNYYFASNNQQIDYPHEGKEGAISFADFAARLADPAALQRVEGELAQAHAAGRRVWFLVDHTYLKKRVPYGERLPAHISFDPAGQIRCNQLYTYLVALYGPPQNRSGPMPALHRREDFRAYLFLPHSSG